MRYGGIKMYSQTQKVIMRALLFLALLSLSCFEEIKLDNPFDPNGDFDGHPVIELDGGDSIVMVKNDDYFERGFTVKDEKDSKKTLTKNMKITAEDEDGDTIKLEKITCKTGEYIVSYDVTDSDDKDADTQIRQISVVNKDEVDDTIAPVIELIDGSVSLSVGEEYVDPGYKAIDNPGKENITGCVFVDVKDKAGNQKLMLDFYKKKGTYYVSYDVQDSKKNVAKQKKRRVTVGGDDKKPDITLNGDDVVILYIGDKYHEKGATAYDNVDGDLTDEIKIDGSVNTDKKGTYELVYSVSDRAGNKASVTREIRVKEDTERPIITLNGDKHVYVDYGGQYKEKNAKAHDKVDGDLTEKIVIGGDDVNVKKLGDYTITYRVADKAGNKASKSRTVTVQDTLPPVIDIIGPEEINLTVGNKYTERGATARDSVDGDLTEDIITTGEVNYKKKGEYNITYTVSDHSGNKAVAVRKVTIIEALARKY